jgi:N-acetylglucosamine malate deacetylase 1
MSTVLSIAPHPDDETLGCGGTLLKHAAEGDDTHWLIVTAISEATGFAADLVQQREREINHVAERYRFAGIHRLDLPTTQLDVVPTGTLVEKLGTVFKAVEPEVVYLPYRHDVHTDHAAVFDAAVSCTKWFRYPSVRRVLVYETLSESDFTLNPDVAGFRPNVFVDVTAYIDDKINIMGAFESEMGVHPFPRSERTIRALADLRGAAAGCEAAEAFMLLRERV